MGLRSGLYGGRKRNQVPRSRNVALAFSLLGWRVVEDDDIAAFECPSELGSNGDLEDLFDHRPVDDPRRGQPIAAQAGDEGLPARADYAR